MESIQSLVREAEENYTHGNTSIGEYVDYDMYQIIETIYAYLNSQHITGKTDSLGREKPFFNVCLAVRNIWYRATDIDRKNLRFIPTKTRSVLLAFVANVILQNWMNETRFGQFLNKWGKNLADYGSSVVKFVERDDELIPMVVSWKGFIPDPIDFDAIPRIEKYYKTPAQLKAMATPNHKDYRGFDMAQVEALITSRQTRETLNGKNKDDQNKFIEIYEVHGELDSRYLEDEPDLNLTEEKIKYRQQMHVISFTKTGENTFQDFTLYKGKEDKDRYMITHLIEEDGRTLSIGAIEYLFDAQWMQNHTVKNMKDTLDISSKIIFQTADSRYVNRNVLSAIESGDIFIHDDYKPLTQVNNTKTDITSLQNFGIMWQNLIQEITSTPDAMRGTTMPSGTPYSLGAFLGGQANSLFEIMIENKGLHLEDMMKIYIIPHIKKKLKNRDEIAAILEDAGIEEIDSMYIPKEAVRRYNKRATEQVLNGENPEQFNPAQEEQGLQQELAQLGNKRFFTPDEIGEKMWDDIFNEFQWDSIRFEVTGENVDKASVLTTLSSVLQTVGSNPQVLQDPNAKTLFNAILAETGRISPIQLSTAQRRQQPNQVNLEALQEDLTANNTQ